MNLPNAIAEKLGTPDSVYDSPSECRYGEHDWTHRFAHRITTQYQIKDTDQFWVVQATYCKHKGCSTRQDKMWYIDEPFDWNTNPPIVEESQ